MIFKHSVRGLPKNSRTIEKTTVKIKTFLSPYNKDVFSSSLEAPQHYFRVFFERVEPTTRETFL